MKQVLLFVPLSNKHRLPIMEQIAREERRVGNSVSIYVELVTPINDDENSVSLNIDALLLHLDHNVYERVFVGIPSLIQLWQMLKRTGSGRKRYLELRKKTYSQILRKNKFDYIYLWNGNFSYQANFIKLAKKLCLNLKYVEVAWFDQNNTYYVDPKGVNANSIIAGNAHTISENYLTKGQEFCKNYKDLKFSGCSISDSYILVPMQVESDSNIRLYSSYKSMSEFIDDLSTWLPENVEVRVRRHPKSAMPEFSLPRNFSWSQESNLFEDIAGAKCVVGINSTVLLQSLALGKPVIAMGQGVWGNHHSIIAGNTSFKFRYPEFDMQSASALVGYLIKFQKHYDQNIFKEKKKWGSLVIAFLLILGGCRTLLGHYSAFLLKFFKPLS
ncbi:capsular polysaccharide export protein, LipB/KpsS family [Microbulbifer sp. JMSA002]|uniref:capsular polysaccharide export protein, LipB/KpsS family n=1 Tax=Microbulbifer sp. JMSA002 TaxID=3243368 RepID=UPI004039A2AB